MYASIPILFLKSRSAHTSAIHSSYLSQGSIAEVSFHQFLELLECSHDSVTISHGYHLTLPFFLSLTLFVLANFHLDAEGAIRAAGNH